MLERKTSLFLGLLIGSTIGGFVPGLWGDSSLFSFASIMWSSIGAIVGIYVAHRLSN
jgi:uncharacterized membrane protein YeaQ/YmgE (transglycosylase-associated protein family)